MIDPRFYTLRDGGISVVELCARLDLPAPDGSFADTLVRQPAPLATSMPGDLCFLESKRHISALDNASASACFVHERLADKVAARHIIPIVCNAPKYQLSCATDLLVYPADTATDIAPTADIHPSVHIGPGVKIADGVKIGPNSVITNAVIGRDT